MKSKDVSCLNDCFGLKPGTEFLHVHGTIMWVHLQEIALVLQASGQILFFMINVYETRHLVTDLLLQDLYILLLYK